LLLYDKKRVWIEDIVIFFLKIQFF
jgi:hypothetical protein